MPLIQHRPFKSPLYQFNGHLQTIVPSLFRKVEYYPYERERIFTPDEDFLDLDWLKGGFNKLVVMSHGLEGDSNRHYIRGTAKLFHEHGWDVCAWNCRSCSGELNWQPRFYHHGDTPDLALVIDHALASKAYEEAVIIGYSMGGSLTLKYFGERGETVNPIIKRGIAFSVPCYLPDCVKELERPSKRFYNKRFYRKLREKLVAKAAKMPNQISLELLNTINIDSCRPLDQHYFAPLHGYNSADEFYDDISSWHHLDGIRVPTLLVTAQNDPFLTGECYPVEKAKRSDAFQFEIPEIGGHVGFCIAGKDQTYAELRALEFAETGK
ncbi:MAG: YheT family hydrolase [Flammeovirgaceae bacterium]